MKEIKKVVKEKYGEIARQDAASSCGPASGCCGAGPAETISKNIGYTKEDFESAPEGANLGLGCGNPVAIAHLKEGETVVDLGSGAGFDCFLAAQKVGPSGKVIGIDMTPEMIKKANENALKGGFSNAEFKLGEIENLPLDDDSADIIISNCVINLSPDKASVFKEAYRVLKPGGRIMISDIVLLKPLPEAIKSNVSAYVGCISGALLKEEYLSQIEQAGLCDVSVLDEAVYDLKWLINDPLVGELVNSMNLSSSDLEDIQHSVISIKVIAKKPAS